MTHRRQLIALLFALTLAVGRVQGQDLDELQELLNSNVVMTASQTAETADAAPALSTNITAKALRQYGIHTLEEAVNFLSLAVSSSGRSFHGRRTELGSRGVLIAGDQGNHVLVLINNHHINEPGRGTARFDRLAGLPLEIVDHIEVIIGPGSVLYGTNAMLGVINVITKSASEFAGSRVVVEGAYPLSLRAGAAVGHTFEWLGRPGEVTSFLEYFERRGPVFDVETQDLGKDSFVDAPVATSPFSRTGLWGGVMDDTNYLRVPSGFLQLRWGDWTVNVHARYARLGLTEEITFDAPQNWFEEYGIWFDLLFAKVLTPNLDFSVRFYGDNYGSRTQWAEYGEVGCVNIAPCRYRDTRTSVWGGSELRLRMDWLSNGAFMTLFGVDGRLRDVRGISNLLALDSDTYQLSSIKGFGRFDGVIGAYVQQMARPSQWFALNAGARFDYDARFSPVFSPRLAAVADLWDGASGRAVYSQAFRAPGLVETHQVSSTMVSPNLRPEQVYAAEVSLEQRFGQHRLLTGLFWSRWVALVSEVVLSDEERVRYTGEAFDEALADDFFVSQFQNGGRIDNYGVNASYTGSGPLPELIYGINATLAAAYQHDIRGSHRVAGAPALFGNANVGYASPEPWPELGLAVHYIGRRVVDHAFDGEYASIPYASPQVELRATLSGAIGKTGLTYRIIATGVLASRGPYIFGPRKAATDTEPDPIFNPVQPFQFFVGLRYDFAKP